MHYYDRNEKDALIAREDGSIIQANIYEGNTAGYVKILDGETKAITECELPKNSLYPIE